MNGGWGVGWTVELKLNRKKEKNLDSNGGLQSINPKPPLDPALTATTDVTISYVYLSSSFRSIFVLFSSINSS